jgi:hypothetical protein
MDSFRTALERAIRVDDETHLDWSGHTVDYAAFKEILRFFAWRRSKLRSLIRESPDRRVSVDVLAQELSPAHSHFLHDRLAKNCQKFASDDGSNYYIFSDRGNDAVVPESDSESRSDASGTSRGSWSVLGLANRRGRLSQRTVMRRVSKVERQSMIEFLQQEADKAFMFYIHFWQRLSTRLEVQQQSGLSDEALGHDILDLLAFCVVNVLCTRQILIRYVLSKHFVYFLALFSQVIFSLCNLIFIYPDTMRLPVPLKERR